MAICDLRAADALTLAREKLELADERLRATNERLQLADERLRQAIAAGGIGTFEYDAAIDRVEISPELRAMFGFPQDGSVAAETILSLICDEHRGFVREALRKALEAKGDGRYRVKFRFHRANEHQERWIISIGRAFFSNGEAVRVIGTCRDITDEVAMERLLAEKTQLTDQLQSMAACAADIPGAIASFHLNADGLGTFPYASANLADLYGFSLEELRRDARPTRDRIHSDDRERAVAAIFESAQTLSKYQLEYRYDHPVKGMIWLEVQSSPVPQPDGAMIWHGYVQDVTARKQAEAELRASEAKHRALFDSNLIGVCYSACVNGVDGVLTEANDKYLEIVGYSREDLAAGRINWIDMTPPEFQHVNKAAIAEYLTTGKNEHPVEKEYVRKDGGRVPVLVSGAWLDRRIHSGVAFVLDMTERKRIEERERKFQRDRLVVMQTMAAAIAHEINQPLTACQNYIKASSRLLALNEEIRPISIPEALDKAAGQIERAGEIVSRLRSFIAHGEPDMLHVSAHELIRETLEATSGAIQRAGARISLKLGAAKDCILADKTQIILVLTNLIINALEAMEPVSRRELIISTLSEDEKIQISVKDTGIASWIHSADDRDDWYCRFVW